MRELFIFAYFLCAVVVGFKTMFLLAGEHADDEIRSLDDVLALVGATVVMLAAAGLWPLVTLVAYLRMTR